MTCSLNLSVINKLVGIHDLNCIVDDTSHVAMVTRLTCTLILTVSIGIVIVLLTAPANAPQIKVSLFFFPEEPINIESKD